MEPVLDSKGNKIIKSRPSGLRKTRPDNNSLAHRTSWLPSDIIKNLSKKYNENYVIKNFDLEFEKGELVTLLGPSGWGKTT